MKTYARRLKEFLEEDNHYPIRFRCPYHKERWIYEKTANYSKLLEYCNYCRAFIGLYPVKYLDHPYKCPCQVLGEENAILLTRKAIKEVL